MWQHYLRTLYKQHRIEGKISFILHFTFYINKLSQMCKKQKNIVGWIVRVRLCGCATIVEHGQAEKVSAHTF